MRPAKVHPGSTVLTHVFIGSSRLATKTLESFYEVTEAENGSFYLIEDGQRVAVERSGDTDGAVCFHRDLRLAVEPQLAVELAVKDAAEKLSAATDDILRDLTTRPIPFAVFRAYLAETGWGERIVEKPNPVYVWDNSDYWPRQLYLPAQCVEMDEEISGRMVKLAEITGRIELGLRLDLIRRSEQSGL
jgi:hypothetical protein